MADKQKQKRFVLFGRKLTVRCNGSRTNPGDPLGPRFPCWEGNADNKVYVRLVKLSERPDKWRADIDIHALYDDADPIEVGSQGESMKAALAAAESETLATFRGFGAIVGYDVE